MKTEPLVSILINNYNYERFLKDAIDSALNQTYSKIEVIVVDDGSTDNSRSVIESYQDKVTAIFKENGGQASAFNTGFEASQGEIICFLDADDMFQPEKVKEVVKAFTEFEDNYWFFHSIAYLRQNSEGLPASVNLIQNETYVQVVDITGSMKKGKLRGTLPRSISIATSGMCFRRSLLEKILPMPEVIRITSDDYIKYVAWGISSGIIASSELAIQRIHNNNFYTFRPNKLKLKGKIEILTAYWIKQNFPVLLQFSNNLLASGISTYWLSKDVEPESQKLVKEYISSVSKFDKFRVYLKAIYYYIRCKIDSKLVES
jgi:glycosyltransferase involved in cell wall biosynthesis